MKFYPLNITKLEHPTEDTLSITLHVAETLQAVFSYQAGQYLTLKVTIEGKEYRRSYSLSSSPTTEQDWQITVKRVSGGKVSNHLHEHLNVGDKLEATKPSGKFTPDICPENHRSYYLFAAGSGITPMWSIAKTILAVEPYSYVYLLYGNRDEKHIIFKDALEQWQQQYAQRFVLESILSKPLSHQWSALFKSLDYWQGKVGRIESQTVNDFICEHPPQAQRAKYLMCGPGNMIPTVREVLLALDVAAEDILFEYFGNPDEVSAKTLSSVAATLTATVKGEKQQLKVKEGQTLLAAMLAQGIDAPYSCQSGVCGECKVRLVSGQVNMKSHMALETAKLQKRTILTCQAYAQTHQVEIDYNSSR